MSYTRDDDLFRNMISGFESKLQAQLNYQYTHNKMLNELERRQEIERMKKEIVEEVLSRISIMFETGEAIQKINALNKAIEQLEK